MILMRTEYCRLHKNRTGALRSDVHGSKAAENKTPVLKEKSDSA